MRYGNIVWVVVALNLATGCKGNDDLAEGFAKVDEAHKATEAEKAVLEKEKNRAALEAAAAEQKAALEKAKAAQEPEEDDGCEPAEGNTQTTDDIVADDDERAIIDQLSAGSDTKRFRKVAKQVKAKQRKLLPVIRRAFRHENPTVRAQSARVIWKLKDRSKATIKAWKEAILAEADEETLGLWAYDVGQCEFEALLATLHARFACVKNTGVKGTIAETLMKFKVVEALPDIHEALDNATDAMAVTYLIGALKRMPHASSRSHLEAHLKHEKELVRLKAQELLDLLPEE